MLQKAYQPGGPAHDWRLLLLEVHCWKEVVLLHPSLKRHPVETPTLAGQRKECIVAFSDNQEPWQTCPKNTINTMLLLVPRGCLPSMFVFYKARGSCERSSLYLMSMSVCLCCFSFGGEEKQRIGSKTTSSNKEPFSNLQTSWPFGSQHRRSTPVHPSGTPYLGTGIFLSPG